MYTEKADFTVIKELCSLILHAEAAEASAGAQAARLRAQAVAMAGKPRGTPVTITKGKKTFHGFVSLARWYNGKIEYRFSCNLKGSGKLNPEIIVNDGDTVTF